MYTRPLLLVALSTFIFACSGDTETSGDTLSNDELDSHQAVTGDTGEDAAVSDVSDLEDSEDADVSDSEDADVACPDDRVPRVVDGVVVDPCGCCAIDNNYCHGHRVGGSPVNGTCPVVYDDAPPCTTGVDDNGCETYYCSGSCLDPPDTASGEPDAG